MKDLRFLKIHTRDISQAMSNGLVEKVRSGLYKLKDYPWEEHSALVDVCRAKKDVVICLTSALEYHDLTTFNPPVVTVAVPHSTSRFELVYPPISLFYFREAFYSPGIQTIQTKHGGFRIYNREKTVCDMFRYRKKLGEDLALEGLKNYLKLKQANVNKLKRYAEICQVKTVMMPYLKAILG
jgi:predicted transcriptional regulator of viral defense system